MNALGKVDFHVLQVLKAQGVDVQLHPARLELLVQLANRFIEVQIVREAGATSSDDTHPDPLTVEVFCVCDFLDLRRCQFRNGNHVDLSSRRDYIVPILYSFSADVNRARGASAGGGDHGSLERVPGDFFRALAGLYVQRMGRTRRALAAKLRERLGGRDIRYHIATLERQLAGGVKSIPPEVQQAMRELAIRDLGFRTDADIETALEVTGACVASVLCRPAYVATRRVAALGALLQRVSSSRSRRAVACCLASRLRHEGLSLGVNALQNILRGKQPLARREILEQLLALLRQHGIHSEADAEVLWRGQKDDIASYLDDRTFEPAARFVDLATVWKLRRREASSRGLARAESGPELGR